MSKHENLQKGLPVALLGFSSIVLPAALTLNTIKQPGTLQIPTDNPSPLGYTTSLLLFIMPGALLLLWLLRRKEAPIERKAFFATLVAVFGVGCILDFVFAYKFFTYTNRGATLGIRLPALDVSTFRWVPDYLPIEEFGFYIFGAFFMLGLYVWADLSWMPHRKHAKNPKVWAGEFDKPVIKFDWRVALVGVLVCALAVLYRKLFVSDPGFPGYFIFLMCIGFIPTTMMLETAGPLINWQAFTLMFSVLQMVSLLWEASLGVPYNWWNYHHNEMIGVFIGAWAQLPMESVLMWILGGWATVIAYEQFRLIFYHRALIEAASRAAKNESTTLN
jgi:hypothetical protein